HGRLDINKPCNIRSGVRQARDHSGADRIGDNYEDDWDSTSLPMKGDGHRGGIGEDRVRLYLDQFFRELLYLIDNPASPSIFDQQVLPNCPSQFSKAPDKSRDERLRRGVALGVSHQHADPSHPVAALLRPRREGPRRRRAAEKRDELAPLHSITLS